MTASRTLMGARENFPVFCFTCDLTSCQLHSNLARDFCNHVGTLARLQILMGCLITVTQKISCSCSSTAWMPEFELTYIGREVQEQLFSQVTSLFHDLDMGMLPISVLLPYLPIPAHNRRDRLCSIFNAFSTYQSCATLSYVFVCQTSDSISNKWHACIGHAQSWQSFLRRSLQIGGLLVVQKMICYRWCATVGPYLLDHAC